MADRSSATVRIGGRIATLDVLDALVAAIISDDWSPEWDRPFDTAPEVEDALLDAADEQEPLLLTGHDKAGGGFGAEVLSLAEEHRLHACWTWDGACGAYEGGMARFHPAYPNDGQQDYGAWHQSLGSTETAESDPGISLAQLREWREAGTLLEHLERLTAIWSKVPAIEIPDDVRAALHARRDDDE